MTDDERDELIEKSLLKQLNSTEEAQVQQLRLNDASFREEYEFQEKLMQQVQFNRREDLLNMFAGFEAQLVQQGVKQDDQADVDDSVPVIPLWQESWFRVAASVLLAVLVGAIIWWQLSKYDPKPIAKDDKDSTKTQTPTDSQFRKPVDAPNLPQQAPQGPIAQKPTPTRVLEGNQQLPYYETNNFSLGFGKNGKSNENRPVIFRTAPEPTYVFDDTLTIYLPKPPVTQSTWSLVYDRTNDTYYLVGDKVRYEIIKGLQRKQPLKAVH